MKTPELRILFVFVCCSLLRGGQHIFYRNYPESYSATVDDSLASRMKLQLLPVFSPLIDTAPPQSPYFTAGERRDKFNDKIMFAPQLEFCQHGEPNCPPTVVNDAFFRNAAANLQKGRKQVEDLTRERVPESLEPVRRFLLDNLKTAVKEEEARYKYIKIGDVTPLKAMLDRYCTIGQEDLIRRLEDAPDAETRRELSWHDWHNAILQCYTERIGKYPEEAWKRFVREYHVRESLVPEPE